jgi:HEAT repeat protein
MAGLRLAATLAPLVLLAHAAGAQPRARPTAPHPASGRDAGAQTVRLPADTIKRLRSGDPAQVQSALDDVRVAGRAGAPAAPAIVELLRGGLSAPLTKAAVETLGDTESEAGSEALVWYARHRNAEIRRAAVSALAKTRGEGAAAALRVALSDPDPAVRGLSATGLGVMKAKDAVGDLFVALDHKVPEAAASIGLLCAGNECDKLASRLGTLAFDVVTSGLEQVLFRPTADVSDDLKAKLVGRVRDLGTSEAHRFLLDVQKRWPSGSSPRVKEALDQAALSTASSPASAGAEP